MVNQPNEVKELIKYSTLAYKRGLVNALGGNASVRIPELNEVYIKSTATSMGEMTEEDLVIVDLQGQKIRGKAEAKASKEVHFHLAIYRRRDDINSIFHLHSPYATAFAVCSTEIPLLTITAQMKLRKIPLVGFAKPGTLELANLISSEVSKQNKGLNALLLERHGIITFGKKVADAFYTAELLEETAKVALITSELMQIKRYVSIAGHDPPMT